MSPLAWAKPETILARLLRARGICAPANTGRLDERVFCLREYGANIYFYTDGRSTLMLDAGCRYPRLREKLEWLGLTPGDLPYILCTHAAADRAGALDNSGDGLLQQAQLCLSDAENQYLIGSRKRTICRGLCPLPAVHTDNPVILLQDRDQVRINDIQVEALLCPGCSRGHLVYLVEDRYLFTGDALWLGADGGCGPPALLAENPRQALESLERLHQLLVHRGLQPILCTAHTGWTADFEAAFAHTDRCFSTRGKTHQADRADALPRWNDSDDTRQKARDRQPAPRRFFPRQ